MEATKTDIAWGNQIRSYVFQPYTMVNDHRTELKISDVQTVMNGDLDPFIEAYLKEHGAVRHERRTPPVTAEAADGRARGRATAWPSWSDARARAWIRTPTARRHAHSGAARALFEAEERAR